MEIQPYQWIVCGYKLHLTSTTGFLISPITGYITTANIPDNQMYVPLTSSSSLFSLLSALYMAADPGDDDKNLYGCSKKVLGIDLVFPLERYKNTFKET